LVTAILTQAEQMRNLLACFGPFLLLALIIHKYIVSCDTFESDISDTLFFDLVWDVLF